VRGRGCRCPGASLSGGAASSLAGFACVVILSSVARGLVSYMARVTLFGN
jgi:hypothetical protein